MTIRKALQKVRHRLWGGRPAERARKCPFRPSLEQLEERTLLAGNVLVEVSGSTLLLTGGGAGGDLQGLKLLGTGVRGQVEILGLNHGGSLSRDPQTQILFPPDLATIPGIAGFSGVENIEISFHGG